MLVFRPTLAGALSANELDILYLTRRNEAFKLMIHLHQGRGRAVALALATSPNRVSLSHPISSRLVAGAMTRTIEPPQA